MPRFVRTYELGLRVGCCFHLNNWSKFHFQDKVCSALLPDPALPLPYLHTLSLYDTGVALQLGEIEFVPCGSFVQSQSSARAAADCFK
jgi:hypothetical protein